MTEKRVSGQVSGDMWLVLIESRQENGQFIHSCGEKLIVGRIYAPIWDGVFKCSGGGETEERIIPYCPKCETKP